MRYAAVVGVSLSLLVVCLSAQEQPAKEQALRFETASVKRNDSGDLRTGYRTLPDGWEANNVSLQVVITVGHNLLAHQLVGGPDWVRTERWDVRGTAGRDFNVGQVPGMVRTLLAERFKLVAHTEPRNVQFEPARPMTGVLVVIDSIERPTPD